MPNSPLTNLFDTHCHLNFSRFKSSRQIVIDEAHAAGIGQIVIPATDVQTSRTALEIAQQNSQIYVAVGIHPHHIFEYITQDQSTARTRSEQDLQEIERLSHEPAVVAIGEVGLDKHYYTNTRYAGYEISDAFIQLQTDMLEAQITLALKTDKSLILHNRDAADEMLATLTQLWDDRLAGRTVLHCCEPNHDLLAFAKQHDIYLGVDGDYTYDQSKQSFLLDIPLEMMVLETDAPYLLPEPYRARRAFPNTPSRIVDICRYVADKRGISAQDLANQTTHNAQRLFRITTATETK